MNHVFESAGVKPWPKLFINLRAPRRTKLEKLHEHHVVNYWLGHGSAIANKHYLRITDEDWADAVGGGYTSGDIPANLDKLRTITATKTPGKPGY